MLFVGVLEKTIKILIFQEKTGAGVPRGTIHPRITSFPVMNVTISLTILPACGYTRMSFTRASGIHVISVIIRLPGPGI